MSAAGLLRCAVSAAVTEARGIAYATSRASRAGRFIAAGTVATAAPLVATAAGTARRIVTSVPGGTVLGEAASAAAEDAQTLPHEIAAGTAAAFDIGPRRARRTVWARGGRAHIEVRGLTNGSKTRRSRLAAGVASALRQVEGVRWAEVNAVTGHVLAAFDEGKVDPAELVAAVESVEKAHNTAEETFSWSQPPHPADQGPITSAVVALAADWLAFGAAVTGKVTRLPALPGPLRLLTALVDAHPPLRDRLDRNLGPRGAELAMALTRAAVHGLTQDPAALAVDAVYRILLTAEMLSRRNAWCAREAELSASGLPHDAPPQRPRPRPLPPGPIETYVERAAAGSLIGAGGALALSRAPGRAADVLLAAVPRAARLGREGFAATLGRELARRGVVPMDGRAYRRFDRITAVVIDAKILCGPATQVLSARATGRGVTEVQVWRGASRVLGGLKAADMCGTGPWHRDGWRLERSGRLERGEQASPAHGPDHPDGMALALTDADGRSHGEVRVGCELDPLADAVLAAARDTGARVLLTEHASATELVPYADDTLSRSVPLSEHVRTLQRKDGAVLLLSQHREEALCAADVGVAVLSERGPVGWSADLICGPGLEQAWRILQAVPVARRTSEHAVRYALGGSSLAALLAVTTTRRNSRHLAPMQTSAIASMLSGGVAARRLIARQGPAPVTRVPWHAMDPPDAVGRAGALRAETAAGEREERQDADRAIGAAYGTLARVPAISTVVDRARALTGLGRAVRDELRDPLTPVLVFGAAASAVVGSGIDAMLVASVMIGNALVSGAQRLRAENELRELLADEQLSGQRVDRQPGTPLGRLAGDCASKVPAKQLRIGDVIALGPADVVPADGRLVQAEDLEVDESSLTGESLPVGKSVEPTPSAALGDRTCMVYAGTTVVAGHGFAVVVAVGSATQAGRAAAVAGRANPPPGAQAQLNELSRISLPATGIGGALVTGLAMLRGNPLRSALASGIAVAVAAVPEGLPLVATVAQLGASRRLSRRDVLVRSSRTLATLGRVDTVCFDKTGTLTEGRLSLSRLAGLAADVEPGEDLGQRLLRTAVRAGPQADPADPESARVFSHATDRAVAEAGKAHLGGEAGEPAWETVRELPFEASRGFSAAAGTADGRAVLAVKGAPEVVLPRCRDVLAASANGVNGESPAAGAASADASARHPQGQREDAKPDVVKLTGARRRAARQAVERLAADGLRVLAVAESPLAEKDLATHTEPAEAAQAADSVKDLTLVGFVGIADAPRATAADTIKRLRDAGTRVVMITGDHQATASAVARRLGIPDADRVLTGTELDQLGEDERVPRIAGSAVFARITPEHKVRIVQALQRAGRVVAMTGDGANDAAAIRLADVGIGVNGRAGAAARRAADLVIQEAGICRIADALLEGRSLWKSIQDAVSILVGGNAGEITFTILGTAVGGQAPLSTRQVLLVNMLTDMMPALAVALAPPAGGQDDPVATDPSRASVGPPLLQAVIVRRAATALGASLAWQTGRMTGRARRAGTMGLAALVAAQLGQTLQTRWRSRSVVATSVLSLLLLAAVIETPGVSQFFGCTPIGPVAWAIVGLSAITATAAGALAPRLLGSVRQAVQGVD